MFVCVFVVYSIEENARQTHLSRISNVDVGTVVVSQTFQKLFLPGFSHPVFSFVEVVVDREGDNKSCGRLIIWTSTGVDCEKRGFQVKKFNIITHKYRKVTILCVIAM